MCIIDQICAQTQTCDFDVVENRAKLSENSDSCISVNIGRVCD